MSTNPIPQLVNIKHTLQSNVIQQIRQEVTQWQNSNNLQYTSQDIGTMDQYLTALQNALKLFMDDNKHIADAAEGVTEVDKNLYVGLIAMYKDYIFQLQQLKSNAEQHVAVDSAAQQQPPQASPSSTDDVKNRDAPNITDRIVDHIVNTLPKELAKDRRRFIDKFIKDTDLRKSLDASDALLQGIVKLCHQDLKNKDNIMSYLRFLKLLGYSKEILKEKLPSSLTQPVKAKTVVTKKKVSPPPQPYIAERKDNVIRTATQQQLTKSKDEQEKVEEEDLDKKKISFSKYLNKDNTPTVTATESNKRDFNELDEEADTPESKRARLGDPNITSILKSGKKKKRTAGSIRFMEDENLVRIYGDDLPTTGLKVKPVELKKILRPFVEGEPNEKVLHEGITTHPAPLLLEFDQIENNDIAETRSGPVPCETSARFQYRTSFASFTSDLKNKPPREPLTNDDDPSFTARQGNGKTPIIARAFGRNKLLLKHDRGGIPYKPVPEVFKNIYPPKYIK
ncbi:RNA-processing protein REF2 KNAG_0A04650 [Huiozyma naganishii CBS 8797]|uniref:Uncharacterized protein n=1 Tax=Huiozyma naganishii (strain ATCC MYA-139 / BCRC 22969 / CBS 8797 / KCTC 17520 / NBRC 10181 / NCYC 3082 / Yp74L-3) TaxID=1071383 RepID=J7RTQ4_HUIN7|nr:hypothetical protein KNAG_0A04650 [Kazachstania naganishii CBS 8797]CCK68137.1 hypothetical protein KNAG_0A04650 [Kazachstania naganishii CBS 8797]